VKRGTTTGRGGGGVDSASTTTIQSSNGNPIVTGSDLGPTVFLIDFWCRLVTADTKNRLFFVCIGYSSHHQKYVSSRYDKPFL
jgi:hypothetical protein